MKNLIATTIALLVISTSAFAVPEKDYKKEIDREIEAELAILQEQISRELKEEIKAELDKLLTEENQKKV